MSQKENSHRYYLRHKKEILRKVKQYHRTHPKVVAKINARWRRNHPDAAIAHDLAVFSRRRKSRYHATPEWFRGKLLEQKDRCAICKKEERLRSKSGVLHALSIDHDHRCCPKSGASCGHCLRGLLCRNCNRMIGLASDSTDVLLNAVAYLNKYKEGNNANIRTGQ